ncbi:hypothetical protein [Frondihabitans sp. 762G35]|uniref:hypothetical protein n=1 Tax=Frondihabitans sp. 762G35 TaxID=1446794 RepID=UPI000F4FFCDC|nr:hypothetical protein [Frondihabitans sp. 762G35]
MNLLEEHDKLVSRDNGGIRTGMSAGIPLPATMVALDELQSFRRAHPGDTLAWVADYHGAADAVHFARAVKGAMRSFPAAEGETKITRTRCPRCEGLTLIWKPPRFKSDMVSVKCMDPVCGFELDQTSFEMVSHEEVHRVPSTQA